MFWPSRPLKGQKFSHSMHRQNSRTGDRLKILVMLEYISLFCNGNDTADADSNFDDNGSDDDDDDNDDDDDDDDDDNDDD